MSKEFNWQEFIEELDFSIMSLWVMIKDDRRELREQGKPIESDMDHAIEILDTVLELFYEKDFKGGFSLYFKWYKDTDRALSKDEYYEFKEALKYLGLDVSLLDGIRIK